MIKIRIFSPNERGKIEFTKEELQKLLNEVYNEGKMDNYTISYGSNITTTPYSYPTITANNLSTSIDKNNLTSITTDVKD